MLKIEKISDTKIALTSPFHPLFPDRAKKIGGRFDGTSQTWRFDARDEAKVRELCIDLWGTMGGAYEKLTVRCLAAVCTQYPSDPKSFYLGGRQVARIMGRDSGAKLGQGVVVLSGKGFFSAGSAKYPVCKFDDGSMIEVRDLPRVMAERIYDAFHGVTLLDAQGNVVREPTSRTEPDPVIEGLTAENEAAMAELTAAQNEVDRLTAELAAAEKRLAAAQASTAGAP